MSRIVDIGLWISRRLRLAVLAFVAVAAVKTGAGALDAAPGGEAAQAPIQATTGVAGR